MKLILQQAARANASYHQPQAAPWPGIAIRRLADEPVVRRIGKGWMAFATLLVVGTAGYMLVEGWTALDALFMTAITLSTVGYGEVQPLSAAGEVFSVFLIFFGVGAALYTFNAIIQTVLEGQLGEILEVRKMKSRIDALQDHFIVCGFGRVGYEVALELQAQGVPFVLIENDSEVQERAHGLGYLYVSENATAAEALEVAGIRRARCLIAVVGSDAENTYIALCGRALNPDLFIVARADSALGEDHLRQAGADKVISPYRIGGRSIALAAVQPQAGDLAVGASGDEWIAEIEIGEGSDLVGMTFGEFCRERAHSSVVLGLYGPEGRLVRTPSTDRQLGPGDRMLVLGDEKDPASMKLLSDHAAPREPAAVGVTP
jgi:voltage-gated potassium channel